MISIGNNRGHAHEVPLLYAQRDARQFLSVFQRFGDTHPTDSVLLEGRSAADILLTLRRVQREISGLEPQERENLKVIVYYSGHADGSGLHPGNSRLAYSVLRRQIASLDAAVRILVVDGCRSGGLTRVKGARPAPVFEIVAQDRLLKSGFAMISSSTSTEDSHESDQLKGSFFTHHFLNALRGVADRNRDGKVSLRESYDYAYRQTLRSSSSTLSLQHPTLDSRMRGRGDLTLSTPALANEETGKLVLRDPSVYLIWQAGTSGEVVAELQTRSKRQMLRLMPGRYQVQQRGSHQYRDYEIELRRGETIELQTQKAQVSRYEQLVRKGGPRDFAHSVMIGAGARAPIAHQPMFLPQVLAGYTLHLAHFSLTGRLQAGQGRFAHQSTAHEVSTTEQQLAVGLGIERYVDLGRWSLAFGLWSHGVRIRQKIRSPTPENPRRSFGAAFAGTVALQWTVSARWGLRLELGPVTYLVRRAKLRDGVEVGTSLQSPFTGVGHVGAYYRF